MKKGKLIIFSAPSGSGKTTIVKRIMGEVANLSFSVSAASRKPRLGEVNGVDYYFFSPEEFKEKIENQEFLEWEEVYENQFYGTLKSEVDAKIEKGINVVFDVDVVGGVNIKNFYGKDAISIFVKPPSVEELRKRLLNRGTETPETLAKRIGKAEVELGFSNRFDVVIVNDNLDEAVQKTKSTVINFIEE